MHLHTNDVEFHVPSIQRQSAVYQNLQPVPSRTSDQEAKCGTNQSHNPANHHLVCVYGVGIYLICQNIKIYINSQSDSLETGINSGWFHQDLAQCVQTEKENSKTNPKYQI